MEKISGRLRVLLSPKMDLAIPGYEFEGPPVIYQGLIVNDIRAVVIEIRQESYGGVLSLEVTACEEEWWESQTRAVTC